jgi:tetratricopeptide (TPR) repeat protein
MPASRTDSWNRARQSFADQFEPRGNDFIYRKSQKGAGFKVTSAERHRFVESFDNHLRRAKWIIGIGCAVVLGIVVALSMYLNMDPSTPIIFAGVGLAMIPYLAYFRWAWVGPARELANRIPVAGERSPEDVQRLRFQRMSYGQLASAAFGGLAVPFVGVSRGGIFSGWNELWLVFGGAIVLLTAVQALRKWRFEHENPFELPTVPLARPNILQPPDHYSGSLKPARFARYLPFAAIAIVLAFVFLTPVGKRMAQFPMFWPIAMACLGLWPLFTVVQGYRRGLIEPFARGFYNTYERESQPARFWASMGWNALLGAFLLWAGFQGIVDAPAQALSKQCYDFDGPPQEQLSACNQLVNKGDKAGVELSDLLNARGSAHYRLGDYAHAMTDYTEAIRLDPSASSSRYNRALVDEQLGDKPRAVIDYGDAIRLQSDNADAYLNRGNIFLDTGKFDQAVADFTRVHDLRPNDLQPLADRGISYAWKRDPIKAEQDFAAVRAREPSNPVLLRGEALLSMNAGNFQAAIGSLNAALKLNPNDTWSLRMRIQAYRQNREFEKARAEASRLEQIARETRA